MINSTVFFLGTVRFKKATIQTTDFEVGGPDTIISVRNDIHLRFNKGIFSTTFQILAPMTAITVIQGQIADSMLVDFELQKYLELRDNKSLRKKFAKEIKDKN